MPNPQIFFAAVLSCCLGALNAPSPAAAQITAPWPPTRGVEVPAGCETPKISPTRREFYVDPVNGAADGDGSQSHPWNSLQDVLTKGFVLSKPPDPDSSAKLRRSARVLPGDVIRLKSGDYGNIKIQGYYGSGDTLVAFDNTDFITIEAAPGATPVVGNLVMIGGGKWVFRGLTFENIFPNLESHSNRYLVAFTGPHHDIIFDNNILLSKGDTSGWSQADWLANAPSGVYDYGGSYNGASCTTISNNKLTNVSFGISSQRSNNVLIKGNTVDHFLHTAVIYGSNNMNIERNIVTNRIDAGDVVSAHPQFMRGTSWGCTAADEHCDTLTNIVIDSNIAIRQTDPNLPFARISKIEGGTMGIVLFDGQWYDLRVTNNVVVTSEWHGLAYYGVHHAIIANNIVLSDGNSKKTIPWITIQNEKNHEISSDIIIRNNITTGLNYAPQTVNMVVDHNLCIATTSNCNLGLAFGGKLDRFAVPGNYGDDNIIDPHSAADLFNKFTVVDGTVTDLDLRLKPGTRAVGTGNPEAAPRTDITGSARTLPYDLGAYKFVKSASPTANGAQ